MNSITNFIQKTLLDITNYFNEKENQIIFILALICFTPLLTFNFFFLDDFNNIIGNPLVQNHNFDTFVRTISTSKTPIPHLIWSTITLIFGTSSAVPFLLLNLLIHISNTLLLNVIFRKIFSKITNISNSNIKKYSLFTALIFMLHPMQVQALSWPSELRTIISTFFVLISLIFFHRVGRNSDKSLNLSYLVLFFVFYLLGLMSKPIVASFVLILSLYSLLVLKDKLVDMLLKLFPLIIFTIVMTVFHVQDSLEENRQVTKFLIKIITVFFTNMFYLKKSIFPVNLDFIYPIYRNNFQQYLDSHRILLMAEVFLSLIAMLIFSAKTKLKPLFFAIIFIVIILLPTSGILDFNYQMTTLVADRYAYLSLTAIAFFISYSLLLLQEHFSWLRKAPNILLVILMILSVKNIIKYSNTSKLLEDSANNNPLFNEIHLNYLVEKGNLDKAIEKIQAHPESAYFALDKLANKLDDKTSSILLPLANFSISDDEILFHPHIFKYYLKMKDLLRAKQYLDLKTIMFLSEKEKEKLYTAVLKQSKESRIYAYQLIGDSYLIEGKEDEAFNNYAKSLKSKGQITHPLRIDFIKSYTKTLAGKIKENISKEKTKQSK